MCMSELMVKVPCQRSVVDTKKPHTSANHPPTRKRLTASVTGGTNHQRLSHTSSGYLRRSLTRALSVDSYLLERIHTRWLQKKPSRRAECTSPGWSEYLWWARWWLAHQRTPFCELDMAPSARKSCMGRLVR